MGCGIDPALWRRSQFQGKVIGPVFEWPGGSLIAERR
jgi:hypothetical protein